MLHALVLADQHGARHRAVVPAALEQLAIADERFDALLVVLQQVPVLLAEGDLLQLVGDASLQKPPVVGGRIEMEQAPPQRPDLLDRQVGQLGDLRHH